MNNKLKIKEYLKNGTHTIGNNLLRIHWSMTISIKWNRFFDVFTIQFYDLVTIPKFSLFLQPLSQECKDEVDKTFKIFDVDGSDEIDRDEALKHWKSSFGKLSAREFFN